MIRSVRLLLGLTLLAGIFTTAGLADVGTSGAAKTKSPIKVMVMVPLTSQVFTDPEAPVGAQAAAKGINRAGGINGHPLKVIVCDTQLSPAGEQACAQKAVSDHVAATVGSITFFSSADFPILQAASIPVINPYAFSATDVTSPITFLLNGGEPATAVAQAYELAKAGCKRIATLGETQGKPAYDYWAGGAKVAGIKSVGEFFAPTTGALDWTPYVSAAIHAGADCIASDVPPSGNLGLLQTIHSIGTGKIKHVSVSLISKKEIKQVGSLANGVMYADPFPPPSAKTPGTKLFVKQLKAFKHNADPVDIEYGFAWEATQVFAQVAKKLHTVTAPAVFRALGKEKAADPIMAPKIDLSRPNPLKNLARVFTTDEYLVVVKHGTLVLIRKKPLNTQRGLALSQTG